MKNNNISCNKSCSKKVDVGYHQRKWRKLIDDGSVLSVLLAGVGGQGILLTSKVLSEAAMLDGLDVKVSEVHGMAQRGGSVVGGVRMGKRVCSPVAGKADFIMSLEKLEALRYINKLRENGFIILSDVEIYPISVYSGDISYPKDINSEIENITFNYIVVKAVKMAKRLNKVRVANIILLGCLSNFIPISYKCWIESIKKNVPHNAIDVNLKAFEEGKRIIN